MNSATYQLRLRDTILSHTLIPLTWKRPRLLHDYQEDHLEIDALVASGDCFETLATKLDATCEALTVDKPRTEPELEKLTRTLLYLQRHYKITRKYPK